MSLVVSHTSGKNVETIDLKQVKRLQTDDILVGLSE